jgi:hypothetical protein
MLWLVSLLGTCWLLPASAPESTSPEPSLLRLTEGEIVSMFEPDQPYSARELAYVVLELQVEARAEIRATSEQAAAEAVRPVLVELAGARAERDEARTRLRTARVGFLFAGVVGIIVGVLGSLLAGTVAPAR